MGKKSHKNGSGEGKSNAKAVVLKVAMHCECDGCINKIRKGINKLTTLEGVEEVEAAGKKGEVKVVATADPEKLRRCLHEATGKHVDLVVLTKEVKNPTTTHTHAMHCDCDGCVNKIRKGINKPTTLEGVKGVKPAAKKGDVKVVVTADPEKLRRCLHKDTGKHVGPVALAKDVKDPTPRGKPRGIDATFQLQLHGKPRGIDTTFQLQLHGKPRGIDTTFQLQLHVDLRAT